ncbi:MAG: prefoldin subunit beta [Candidatus Aenigmatarchaeota archaeon]
MVKKTEKPVALPPEAQQMLMQLQAFRQQLQALALQKESLQIQKLENEKALEELGKTKQGEDVFRAVGPILIKSSKKKMEKELKERNESIDLRLKTFEKQEAAVNQRVMELQKKLQQMLSGTETAG